MTQEVKLRRVQCNYQPENARFMLECDFSKQYDHYYRRRLQKTRPYIEFNCRQKWDPDIPIYNLAEIATFGCGSQESDIDSDIGSTSIVSSPGTPHRTDNNLFCNYKFKKRIRKHSNASPAPADRPLTSTQAKVHQLTDADDDDDDEIDDEFTSPILGAQKITSARTARVSSPRQIRRPTGGRSATCIVIGTIFKRMKLQPDVVEELSKGDFHVKCERYFGHYTSQDDTLVLEDSEESIQLVGNINPKQFVTGIIVALLGVSVDDGSQFLVHDICFAEPNPQLLYDVPELSIERPLASSKTPIYLMLVSGMGFHHEMEKKSAHTKALQDMIDFIWGGAKFTDDPRSSRVARILVMGNSLHEDRFLQDGNGGDSSQAPNNQDEIFKRMKQSRQVKQYSESIQAVKHMDDFFAQLSKTINVDVMPGASDPSSHLMPQQPFHPCMFPKSCMFSTFNCITNPHHAIYNDNVELLATSGQNVDIISKFSGLTDPLEIMKCHLLWGNNAPSAPDNLYSAPYEDDDPYVIDFIPDIYAIGCQISYKIDYYQYTSSDPSVVRPLHSRDDSTRSSLLRTPESDVLNVTPDSILTPALKMPSLEHHPSANSCLEPSKIISANEASHDSPETAKLPAPISAGQAIMESQARQGAEHVRNSTNKRQTLLVSVPSFCDTLSCVLIDLTNLQPELLSFK